MTNYGRYQQFCFSVGVQPMPEMLWAAFSDSIKPRDVSGIISKAAMALFGRNTKTLHDDRQINPTPKPKLKHIRCGHPTRTMKQRDYHARDRRRLSQLQQLQRGNPHSTHNWPPLYSDANGKRIALAVAGQD
jgi:hypothetical protein